MIEFKFPCGYELKIKNSFWDYITGNAMKNKDIKNECPIHGKKCKKGVKDNE